MFCRSLFVLLYFFAWPLCCLFVFDIRILIVPLVSSNSSSTCHKHFPSFTHSWLITRFVTRLTPRVPLVEQELITLPDHLSSSPGFSGVRVTRSLILCVCFVDRFLSFRTFSFSFCVVCPSLNYRFWLPIWYHQTCLRMVFSGYSGYSGYLHQ